MKALPRFLAILFIFSSQLLSAQFQVGHKTITFTDPARSNRSIATEVYYPADVAGNNVAMSTGQFPLIVFGHGFIMADPALYTYLWQAFVQAGYIFAFPTTEGSMFPTPSHLNFGLDLKFLNVQIKSENTIATSFFFGKVDSKSMIMGHSMGGKGTYIGSANNTDITAVVSLGAAMSNPPIGTATDAMGQYAPFVVVPTLVVDAEFDCVVGATDGHKYIYDTLTSSCKTYVNIKGGGHCFFASSDASNCETGEGNCSGSFTITRAQQNQTVLDFVLPYVNFMLKSDVAAETAFLNYLNTSTAILHERDCKANDLTTTQITAPVSICTLTNAEVVTVKIKNNGSLPQSNFQVAYQINATAPVVEIVNATIASGVTLDYTFTQQADFSAAGTYTLKAYTILTADEDHANDTLAGYNVVNNNVSIPIVVNFTGFTGANIGTVFPGWNESNTVNHTGTTSTWLNRTGLGGTTNVTAKVNFTGTTINEWLIGPAFKPAAYTQMIFEAAITGYNATTAYANGMSANDQVKIMVSTDCGITWTMVDVQNSTSGLTNTLNQKIVDLGAYDGQSIIIAFYATRSASATNNYDFHIDNINIKDFAPYDISPIALVSPVGTNTCRTNSETISVKVHNYGIANIDFTVNPMTVNVVVSGAQSANFTQTLNTGTLASDAEMNVVLTSAFDMTANGAYVFTVTSSTVGDGNTANDNLAAVTLSSTNPGVYITGDTILCSGETTVLMAHASVSGNAADLVLSNSIPFNIPDNNTVGIQSPIIVTSSTALASQVISVTIDSISHTYVGDLKLSLIAPNGTIANLVVNRGVGGDNFTGTIFISSASASITTGTAPFTGQFLPEQTFSTLTGNAQGTWNLKAVDNSNQDLGIIKGWTIKLPNTNLITNYAWSTSENGATTTQINYVAPVASSTCSVTVTDAVGCFSSSTVGILITTVASYDLGQDITFCEGSNAVIDAGAGYTSYLWHDGSVSQTFNVTVAGIVAVTVTGVCGTVSDQINIIVNALPVVSITSSSNPSGCEYNNGTASASVGNSYLWNTSPAQTTQQAVGLTAGLYTVSVSDGLCSNTASVTLVDPAAPTVTLVANDSNICTGSSVMFVANGAAAYEFFVNNISQGAASVTNTYTNAFLSDGDIVMVLGTVAGCVDTSTAVDMNVSIPIAVNITDNNGTLTSSAISGNQWFEVTNGIIGGATNSTFSPTANGNYYTVVTNNQGCTVHSDTVNFVYVSAYKIQKNETIIIFPNPNKGIFNVKGTFGTAQNNSVDLLNLQGQIVLKTTGQKSINYNETFDVSHLAKGTYYLKMFDGTKIQIHKIVIE